MQRYRVFLKARHNFVNLTYEVIILPVTIRVVKYIKKVDGNDVYDLGTSYNILKVKDI